MTTNQSTALVKNPNTKRAISTLQRLAKMEAQYKQLEKESKEAVALIKEAMIEQNIERVTIDTDGLTGYITLAERTNYKAEDLDEVDNEFKKYSLDTEKVKAQAVLTGELPKGVITSKTKYITKSFKVLDQ